MALIDDVSRGITEAMKSRDQDVLGTLRMLKSALTNKEIEKGRALDAAESLQVVSTLVKQRRDSIEQFTKGGRTDLADKEGREIAILERFLPPSASPAAIAAGGHRGHCRDRRHQREGLRQGHEGRDGPACRCKRGRQAGQRGRQGPADVAHPGKLSPATPRLSRWDSHIPSSSWGPRGTAGPFFLGHNAGVQDVRDPRIPKTGAIGGADWRGDDDQPDSRAGPRTGDGLPVRRG